jgi:integrase
MSEMRRSSWLFRRNGRYYLRARVPQDIIRIIGKREIKKSLHTSDRTEALERLALEAAEVSELFAAARRKLKAEVEKVTPHLTDAEAKRLAFLWFRKTERESVEDAFRQPELNPVALESAYEELTVLLGDEEEFGPYIQQVANRVLLGAGFPSKLLTPPFPHPSLSKKVRVPDIDRASDVYQKLCERIRRGMIENLRRQQQRYKGQIPTTVDPAFSPALVEKAATGPLLSKILEMWLDERKPGIKTGNEWRSAVRRFTELHGDLPVDAITKAHVRELKDKLLQVPAALPHKIRKLSLPKILAATKNMNRPTLSPGAVGKQLTAIRALLAWSENNGYVEHNVAAGVTVATAKNVADKRVAYDASDLERIFADIGRFRKSEPSRFWLPLLAAYTGARLEELGQLTIDDIRQQEDINYISINAEGGKSVKTRSSIRDVPVHSELVKCGFLEYVAGRDGRLFPDLKPDSKGKITDSFSKRWTRYRRNLGITDPRKVFHSFRHSFKEACRAAGMSEEVHDALTGHSNGSVGRGYGAVPLATKADAINRIRYNVKLDHLYLCQKDT